MGGNALFELFIFFFKCLLEVSHQFCSLSFKPELCDGLLDSDAKIGLFYNVLHKLVIIIKVVSIWYKEILFVRNNFIFLIIVNENLKNKDAIFGIKKSRFIINGKLILLSKLWKKVYYQTIWDLTQTYSCFLYKD